MNCAFASSLAASSNGKLWEAFFFFFAFSFFFGLGLPGGNVAAGELFRSHFAEIVPGKFVRLYVSPRQLRIAG